MAKSTIMRVEKSTGDQAVDGLLAGLMAGVVMGLFLALVGLLEGRAPLVTLGFFDPAQSGNWLTGSLAHLAVSAIYGVLFALLLQGVVQFRPSLARRAWMAGALYGLVLWGVAQGVVFTALPSPLPQLSAWQFGVAHLLYGLALSYRLTKK